MGQGGQYGPVPPGVAQLPGQQYPPGSLPPGLQLPGMVPQSQYGAQGQVGSPGQYGSQGQASGGSAMTQQGLGGGGSAMTQIGLGGAAQTGAGAGGRPGFNPLQGVPQPGMGVANSQMGPANQAIPQILGQLTNPQQNRGFTVGITPNGPPVGTPNGMLPGTAGMMGGGVGMFGAGGIAGVASKYKGEGIKLIEERSKINEWEFIYDPRKDKRMTGGGGMSGQFGGGLNGGPPTGSQTQPSRPSGR